MKKTFEFCIILIIFYGVYSAFQTVAPMLFENPSRLWVVITSLIASTFVLALYSQVVRAGLVGKYQQKIKELEKEVELKDQQVENAFKIKRDVEVEAEETITDRE